MCALQFCAEADCRSGASSVVPRPCWPSSCQHHVLSFTWSHWEHRC